MSLELEYIRAVRRYFEHLAGKHNQKSHANKYGSTAAIKANVKRLGGDKAALKSMAQKARKFGNLKKGAAGQTKTQAKPETKRRVSKLADLPADSSFQGALMEKVQKGEIAFTDAQKIAAEQKHYEKWGNSLSKNEKRALKNYQSDPFSDDKDTDYVKINKSLRGKGKATTAEETAIRGIDSALNKSSVAEDTTVFRGFRAGVLPDNLAGQSITDNGFVSTSINEKKARDFGKVVAEIRVPKGSKGAYLDVLGNLDPRDAENELLLPRGSSFRVTEDTPGPPRRLVMDLEQ